MCGLVGVAGNLEPKDEAFMKRLLVLDYFRGTDSTGLAAVRAGRDIHVAKIASHPINLFDTKKFTVALNGPQSVAFIGHNRAATMGKVNDVSAHPYHYKDVVGAHNGTLYLSNWKTLEKELGYDTSTDSEAIIACIDEFGIEETMELLERGTTSTHGAWALTWFDASTDSMHFIRNKHRPLWYCFNKEMTKVAWASEWEFLEHAVRMTPGWEMFVDKDGNGYFQFQEDVLYSFDMDKLLGGLSNEDVAKVKGPTLKGKEVFTTTYSSTTYTGAAPFQKTTVGNSGGTSSTVSTTTSRGGTNPKVVELFGTKDKPLAGLISEERFLSLAHNGCSFCKAEITMETEGVIIYDADEVILCPDCNPKKTAEGITIYTSEHTMIKAANAK